MAAKKTAGKCEKKARGVVAARHVEKSTQTASAGKVKQAPKKRAAKAAPKRRGRGASAVAKAVARGTVTNAGPMASPLENPRYEQFCQAVHAGVQPRAAAIRCGWSDRSASTQAWRLLKIVEIQRRLAWLHAMSAGRIIARKRDVLAAHSADALSGPADFTALIGMDRNQARDFLSAHPYGFCVREIEIENIAVTRAGATGEENVQVIESRVKRFKLSDSMAARRELGKLLDWYPQPRGMRGRLLPGEASAPGADGETVRIVVEVEEAAADIGAAAADGAGVANDRLAETDDGLVVVGGRR
jgi:hypothetical protein